MRAWIILCVLAASPIVARESGPDGFSLSLDFERIERSEEWFAVPPTGLPLLLPEAAYEIEWMDESNTPHERILLVEAGVTSRLALEAW